MLRNHTAASPSDQPDLPSQRHRGSPYHAVDEYHGYQPPRQHERSYSIKSNNNPLAPSPSATPPRRENAFNAPRPSLLPYQEYHSGFSDADLGTSLQSSPPSHRRHQSISNLLPLAIRNRTPSPTRKVSVLPEEMPYTGDGRSRPSTATESPRGGFAGWLSGTAAGNALDSLSRPSDPRQTTPDATPTRLRKAQPVAMPDNPSTPRSTVSTTASRFMTALSTRLAPAQPSPALDDELSNLDISSALFPPNSPSDRDAFSPAAFKNLQTNAVGLLSRFQTAYRSKAAALRDLEMDRAAQRDELEEAVTRAAHLKMQLEDMAHRAAEQEEAMKQLMDELMAEKHAREEERLVRGRAAVAGSMVSEDLGVDEEQSVRRWRKSGGTEGSYDETDEESVDESVFSRSRSPTTPGIAGDGSGDLPMGLMVRGSGTVVVRQQQRTSSQMPMTAIQKLFKGVVGDVEGVDGCRNCKGKDASVAWDTVSVLRDENKHLKQRVGQLEVAVEGALDMVNGLGL